MSEYLFASAKLPRSQFLEKGQKRQGLSSTHLEPQLARLTMLTHVDGVMLTAGRVGLCIKVMVGVQILLQWPAFS